MWLSALVMSLSPGCQTAAPPAADSAAGGTADSATAPAADCSAPPIDGVEPGAAPAFALDPPPQNLLILSLDTLRRDRLGRYSPSGLPSLSPTIDALLASGLALDDHRSCSDWTMPSMLCVLTGRGFLASPGAEPLGDRLQAAGFQVGVISANPWMHVSWPSYQDYDLYDIDFYEGPEIIDKTLAAVQRFQASGERWFLQSHFMDAHAPYSPDPSYLAALEGLPPIPYDLEDWWDLTVIQYSWGQLPPSLKANILAHLEARYAAEIRQQDDYVAELLAGLEALGALDDTLLVLLSDHGEQLFTRSEMQHGARLYQEESAAIAAFIAPGISPGSWSEPTTHADIAPTILYALGLPEDPGAEGLVVGTARADRPRFAHVVMNAVRQSVDVGPLRLHLEWDGPTELYDLSLDPGETEDLWNPEDPAHQALWDTLQPRIEALDCSIREGLLGWP